jgi:alkanesulfonate monooxygenase SsuD/methylene tetrahydromethanopterin reductase-like flavin-dependent oxidoreductase (luciferase family)
MTVPRFPELGFYTLAGGAQNPRDLVTECRRAEELGLGAVFISERFNVKEAVTLSGAAPLPRPTCRSSPGRPTTTRATRS